MRDRVGLAVSLAIVGLISFWTIEPRLHHRFPSMVDDWNAILSSPEQLHEVLRLGNPEEQRYRPGFVMWNALQWHTFGAPTGFLGPQLWGILRWAVLVVGLTLLAALLVGRPGGARRLEPRWLLVMGVPLVVVTPVSIAIDIARFGPQEILMVGCMSLGAVLLVQVIDRLLDPRPPAASTVVAAVGGLAVWSFGVLQKETSACVLLLAPFLLPTFRAQTTRFACLDRGRRLAVMLVAGGVLLPFVPMLARTIQLRLAGERVYAEAAAAKSFTARLVDQLDQVGEVMHTPVTGVLLVAAFAFLAARTFRLGADWLSTGLVVVALGFIVLAAETGVVASRYFVPVLALLALVVARSAMALGSAVVWVTGVVLIVSGTAQAWDARGWVQWWVEGQQAEETLVREAAARAVGGCRVEVTGLNVELVQALPVLMPLADEAPRDCAPGARYLVVIDAGGPGEATSDDDPVYAACAPDPEPAWSSNVGTILRCTKSRRRSGSAHEHDRP
jgi:hypothetical protein